MKSIKMTRQQVATMVAFALVLGGGVYWFAAGRELASRPPAVPSGDGVQLSTRTFSSVTYSFAFDYPQGYYLASREVGTVLTPQLAVVLVEDTTENRDIIEGRATEAREGPPSIIMDVHANGANRPVREWLEIETNWKLGDGDLLPTMVGEEPGYAFSWSGLYEGGSVVVGHGDKIYVFSVTWLTEGDQIITDYQNVLKSVRFTR